MKRTQHNRIQGFSPTEVIFFSAIIVFVISIGVMIFMRAGSVNGDAKASGRDARRISDLNQISTALVMYYNSRGNWIESGSGCGYNGEGWGWFNAEGIPNYSKSIVRCLMEDGILDKVIIDPSGHSVSSFNDRQHAYLKYHCSSGVYLYAKLERKPQATYAGEFTNNTCCWDCDMKFGVNHYQQVQ